MNKELNKLIYLFGEMPSDNKKSKWELLMFPPQKNLYFISKSLNRSDGGLGGFDDEIRKELLSNNNINSIYDTCGYNPLFLIIESPSVDGIREVIEFARQKNIDMHPDHISFTVGQDSMIKRLGVPLDELNKENLVKLLENNSIASRLLIQLLSQENMLLSKQYLTKKNIEAKVENFFDNIKNLSVDDIKNPTLKKEFKDNKEVFEHTKKVLCEKYKKIIWFKPVIESKITSVFNFIFFRFPLNYPTDRTQIIKKLKRDHRVIDLYEIIGDYEFLIKLQVKDILELYSFLDKEFHKEGIQTITKTVFRIWKEENQPIGQVLPDYPEKTIDKYEHEILKLLWSHGGILEESVGEQERRIRFELESKYGRTIDIKTQFENLRQNYIYKYSAILDKDEWIRAFIFIKATRGYKRELANGIQKWLGVAARKFARKYFLITGTFDYIIPLYCPELIDLENAMQSLTEKNRNYIEAIRVYPHKIQKTKRLPRSLECYEIAHLKAMLPNSLNVDSTQGGEIPRRLYSKHFFIEECGHEPPDTQVKVSSVIPTIEILPESMIQTFIRFKILDTRNFNNTLEQQNNETNVLLKEIRPIHDINTAMFIVITPTFKSLFDFVNALDKYSKNTEISLIFHQSFYKPLIPKKLKCHPCPSTNLEFCDACSQYVQSRKKTDVRDVDYKVKNIKPCKVAVVQIKSELNLENVEDIKAWLDRAANDSLFKKNVIDLLEQSLENGADVIIYPELTIPKTLIYDIKEKLRTNKKRAFVVAGSHYDEEGYNASPILFSSESKEVNEFFQYKNCAPAEEKGIALGVGMLRFTNTGFGDLGVLICYDATEDDMILSLSKKIDILIVPAWEHNPDRALSNLKKFAENKHKFVFYVNNGIYGGSRLFAPFKRDYAQALNRRIIGKDKQKIEIYDIDVIELDKHRNISTWNNPKPTSEEKSLMNKYRKPDADVEPRHKELWTNPVI